MNSMSLTKKMILGFSILIVMSLIIAVIALQKLSGMNDRLNSIVDVTAEKIKLATRINQGLLAISRAEKNIILAETDQEMDKYAEQITRAKEDMKTRREKMRGLVDEDGRKMLDEFASTWDDYIKVNDEVRSLARLNSNVRAKEMSMGEGREAFDALEAGLKQLSQKALGEFERAGAANNAALLKSAGNRVLLSERILRRTVELQRAEKNLILATTQKEMDAFASAIESGKNEINEDFSAFSKALSGDDLNKLDEARTAFKKFDSIDEQVRKLSRENGNARAFALATTKGRELTDKAENLMTTLVDKNDKALEQDKIASDKNFSSALTMVVTLSVLGFLIGIAAAYLILRSIVTPIRAMALAAGEIAKGDLDQKVEAASKDEIGLLADAFSRMITSQKKKADALEAIAGGNVNVEVEMGCPKDVLSKSVNVLKENISALLAETNGLIRASLDGKLDTRGKADGFKGGWHDMVKGMNDLLDAIISPIKEAMKVMSKAADKKLSSRVEGDYKGQLAEFKDNINEALDALDGALSQVQTSVEQVSSASNQISSGSQTLSQGAQEQASSLEEISSSLEEMASMTKQNAENAGQAKTLASSAKSTAEKGNSAMKEMTNAISLIKTSSDETAKIVKTIDEIAFQTNLLALNAAVEAARAGEAGRGFAVVAEEVRNLASRSAEAAKNTTAMIETSVKNAEGGVNITQEVAKFLVEIVDGNAKVNDLIAEIAAASGEQSKGIEQVNIAVGQMNQVTQQNAANSEESAAAAEELNSQSEELAAMVATFELSRKSARPAAEIQVRSPQKRLKSSHNGNGNGNGNGKASSLKQEDMLPMEAVDLAGF